ncbi:sugar transferase [Candidatus Odyssella thessalonicensis]|uniref:sugar transferase n=1 Tax=Candidatus Odyssella thessalonicensis TaxID=84647 RepID=UPI000225AC53|nr:sugar transferase [Candidatus Odyssella thessalonicensis]
MSKRLLDIAIAIICLIIFAIPILLIAVAVKVTSKGPILHWSERIGRYGLPFYMPKFRSMWVDTPQVATSLLINPYQFLTPIGSFLRKSSMDELPQLWSILKGDISFVGPRPALYNEHEWLEMRRLKGIDQIRPGLTGWAQVNGRDSLSVAEKIKFEEEYLKRQSLSFDLYILWLTVIKVIAREGISH